MNDSSSLFSFYHWMEGQSEFTVIPYSHSLPYYMKIEFICLSKSDFHFIFHSMDDPSVLCYDPLESKQNQVYYVFVLYKSLHVEFSNPRWEWVTVIDIKPTMEETIQYVEETLHISHGRHDLSEMGIVKEISNVERRINQLEATVLNRYDSESAIRQCSFLQWKLIH